MIKTKHYGVEWNREDLLEIRRSREQTDHFMREANYELRRAGQSAVGEHRVREVMASEPRTEIAVEFRQEAPPRPERGQQVMHTQNPEFSQIIKKRQPHPPMIYQVPVDRALLLHFAALEDQRRISGEARPGSSAQPSPFAPLFSAYKPAEELSEEETMQLNASLYGELPHPSPRDVSAKKVEDRKKDVKHPTAWAHGYPYDGPELNLMHKKVDAGFVPAVHEKTTAALQAKFAGNRERREANTSPRDSRRWG